MRKRNFDSFISYLLPPLITLSLICIFYNLFATNPYVKLLLKGMQCGATALIINVAYDLLKKELKKKYIYPYLLFVLPLV